MADVPVDVQPARRRSTLPWILIGIAGLVALFFYFRFAPQYITWNLSNEAAQYWGQKRVALLFHIAGGSVALFVGLFQLWSGLAGRKMRIHRLTGKIYLGGVLVGSVGAFGMMPSMIAVFGPHLGVGLGMLAVAWLVTGGMAFYAIRKRNIQQHKEWMIRSYVVTFAFVTFRLLQDYIIPDGLGMAQPDFLALLSWTCWAVPLLITEAILQARKI